MKKRKTKLSILAFMLSFVLAFSGILLSGIDIPGLRNIQASAAKDKISKSKKTLYVGDTFKLKIKGATKKYTWASSDPSVVKVKTKSGKSTKVVALKTGKATITATRKNTAFTCVITVKKAADNTTVTITPSATSGPSATPTAIPSPTPMPVCSVEASGVHTFDLNLAGTLQLQLQVQGKEARRYYVMDSEKEYLYVSEDGFVTALKYRKEPVTVRIESKDYNYYTCKINIIDNGYQGVVPIPTPTPVPTAEPTGIVPPAITPTPTGNPLPTSTINPTGSPTPTSSVNPTGSPLPTSTVSPTTTPVPTGRPIDIPYASPTPTATPGKPYLYPSSATIKVNEQYQINLVGTHIVFCSNYDNNWEDIYAELGSNGKITGLKECKNKAITVYGEDGNTYTFYLTVSGYTDPVEEKSKELTAEDKQLNTILASETYGLLSKHYKTAYSGEDLYYDITDDGSMLKAAYDAFEKGAKRIHLKFKEKNADYWLKKFSSLKFNRSEVNSYTKYYGYKLDTSELIITPEYKDGWNAVLAMKYKGVEIDDRTKELWRDAYRLAKEAVELYPDNVTDVLNYLNLTLCEWVEYTLSNSDHDDASGIFFDHQGVCAGYASAYRLLLNILGLENRVITNEPGDHEWNYVKLNGTWYHVDVTWNDIKKSDGTYYNDWFLLTDDQVPLVAKRYNKPEIHTWIPFIVK